MASHLKHSASGHLMRGPGGHLSVGCPTTTEGCACLDATHPCAFCSGDTPTTFHVTFTGLSLCAGCVECAADGVSARVADGSTINGTYTMHKNGACAWVTESTDIPCAVNLYGGAGCDGTAVPLLLAIEQTRINANTFRLQIIDAGANVVLFSATKTITACCAGYTVANAAGACGCSGSPTTFFLANGGSATVTAC